MGTNLSRCEADSGPHTNDAWLSLGQSEQWDNSRVKHVSVQKSFDLCGISLETQVSAAEIVPGLLCELVQVEK